MVKTMTKAEAIASFEARGIAYTDIGEIVIPGDDHTPEFLAYVRGSLDATRALDSTPKTTEKEA